MDLHEAHRKGMEEIAKLPLCDEGDRVYPYDFYTGRGRWVPMTDEEGKTGLVCINRENEPPYIDVHGDAIESRGF